MDLKDINNNILSSTWKSRYEKLSDKVKEKLNNLDNANIDDYQLQVIMKKKNYPLVGDIFEINTHDNIVVYGIVINNHINNNNGNDLLLVMIFKSEVSIDNIISNHLTKESLLIPPQMVGKEYWTKGYFYNVDHYDQKVCIENYGFYYIGKDKYVDEYGKEIINKPQILGTYGVATISGIARKISQELIISETI